MGRIEFAIGIGGERGEGRESATSRCQEMLNYAKRQPKCSACGSADAHHHFQARDGKFFEWQSRCDACSKREDAKRTAAYTAHVKRAVPESPALRPYYKRLELVKRGAAPMRKVRGLVLRWGDVFRDSTNIAFHRGCCSAVINRGQVVALIGHDTRRVIGRQADGTLLLSERPEGVYADLVIPSNSELVGLAREGRLRGFSIGTGTALDLRRGATHNVCHDYDFSEVSVVIAPYVPTAPGTTIELV